MSDDDYDYQIDVDNMEQQFDKFAEEYLEFDRIPESERLHPCKVICGMMKVHQLLWEGKTIDLYASRDELHLNSLEDMKTPSDNDTIYLLRCGILYDPGENCLYMNT